MFGTVAGGWLQAQLAAGVPVPTDPAGSSQFYVSMPLYLLEVRLDPVDVTAIGGPASFRTSVEGALLDLEGIWVRITLADGGRPATLFDNLFGPAIDVGVASIQPAAPDAGQFLGFARSARSGHRSAGHDRSGDRERPQLRLRRRGDCGLRRRTRRRQRLISGKEVVCYFDFGGGAAPNTFTFPTKLATFCQCNSPPIILSHWDHDHWSSEGRNSRVHARTWIVPRQVSNNVKRAPHHSSLIKAIQAAGGSILAWPSGLSTKQIGQLEINLCTGSSKNNSGLSLEVYPPSGVSALPVLMPADAGYDDLRVVPANGQHDAILCPHHGGHSNSPISRNRLTDRIRGLSIHTVRKTPINIRFSRRTTPTIRRIGSTTGQALRSRLPRRTLCETPKTGQLMGSATWDSTGWRMRRVRRSSAAQTWTSSRSKPPQFVSERRTISA